MEYDRESIQKGVDMINEFIEREYPCATEEDEYLIRKDTAVLFGKLMEMYGEHRGVAMIMADMAYGSMKDMDGACSDVARDFLREFIELVGLTPEETDSNLISEASLIIFGRKDAYIY